MRLAGGVVSSVYDHGLDVLIRDRARSPDPWLVLDPGQPSIDEPLPPLPDRGIRGAIAVRDRRISRAVCTREHELRARNASDRLACIRLVNRVSAARSSSVSVNSGLGRPVMDMPL